MPMVLDLSMLKSEGKPNQNLVCLHDANAISDISAPAPTERKKLAANFNNEAKASVIVYQF